DPRRGGDRRRRTPPAELRHLRLPGAGDRGAGHPARPAGRLRVRGLGLLQWRPHAVTRAGGDGPAARPRRRSAALHPGARHLRRGCRPGRRCHRGGGEAAAVDGDAGGRLTPAAAPTLGLAIILTMRVGSSGSASFSMRVSSKAHYGLRMMTEFAKAYGRGPLSLAEVARVEQLPLSYLEQLAAQLRRGGLVEGTRGVHGGYSLTRPPEHISVLRVTP